MDERRTRRSARRRPARRTGFELTPGVILYAVCSLIIVICLLIGAVQAAADKRAAAAKAEEEAAAQAAQAEELRQQQEAAAKAEAEKYDFTLSFMGDVNLDDGWSIMWNMSRAENGFTDMVDEKMVELMQDADLFCINNEFAFTSRGSALDGKAYTFRAKPENVSVYEQMGVDLVTLSNNHIYDYGPDGLTDTLATLDDAGIAYVGAGENITDAAAPYYAEVQGKTIAFVNASCAEHHRYTPEATEESSGVLLCYDTDRFLKTIREARKNADYVVALVHWGSDYVYETSDEQRSMAQDFIMAGADVIVGTHAHSIQGIEYFNGKPIFYGLGSCLFNDKKLETFMLQIRFTGDGSGGDVSYTLVPAYQVGCTLRPAKDTDEAQKICDLILQYSDGIYFENYNGDEFEDLNGVCILHEGEAPAEDVSDEVEEEPIDPEMGVDNTAEEDIPAEG